MSSDKLFDAFYAVPNPHFNAFFEGTTGTTEEHPLTAMIAAAGDAEQSAVIADAARSTPDSSVAEE
jgi:hypothetical protein